MSQYARKRRLTDTCTYWVQQGDGPYGVVWSTPRKLPVNWMNDSKVQRDDTGSEFQPSAAFRLQGDTYQDGVLTRGGVEYPLPKGARIIRGDYSTSSTPPSNAQTVRKVVGKTKFRGGASVTVYTG